MLFLLLRAIVRSQNNGWEACYLLTAAASVGKFTHRVSLEFGFCCRTVFIECLLSTARLEKRQSFLYIQKLEKSLAQLDAGMVSLQHLVAGGRRCGTA